MRATNKKDSTMVTTLLQKLWF